MANEQTTNVIAFSGNTMVYESVKRFAVRGLNDLIRVLMENVDDALFRLSEKVENDNDRSMYFDAMREIRLKRKAILENFDTQLQRSFDELILNKSPVSQAAKPDELSLVEQEDIEVNLSIENMISKARPHFEDDLFAVAERLKVVLHRKQIKEDQNPLDPKAICESFHKASEILDTDIQVKLIFYKLFDKYVVSNLGHFYRELNEYFIQKGVLPDFKASQERMKHTTKFMANRIARAYSEDQADITNQQQPLNEPVSRPEPGSPSQQVDGNLLAMLQRVFTPASNIPPMNGAGPMTGSTTVQPPPSLNEGTLSEPSIGVEPAAPDHAAYMTALTNLQSTSLYSQPVASVDPQSLKTQLHQQLVSFKQDNSQQGNTADNQIIDIVSMLFDFFFDDETLPDPIKVLLGRLQIPILKVAILDKGFFNHKKHPARKLLDSISKASLGWSEDQTQEKVLIRKIEEIVNFLLNEFDQDMAVFEQALDNFQQFLKEESNTTGQAVEEIREQEQEKDQKIQQAHDASSRFIQGLITKHDLSFDVIDFLDGVWKSVLFNTFLTQGESSSHWINLKRITTTLIWTLIPKHNEQDKNKLLKTLPALLRALSRGMELIQTDRETQNRVFQMLVLEHAKTVKQTSKNLVTRVDDKTIWPEKNILDAFSGYNEKNQQGDSVDFLLSADDTGEIQIVENESEQDPNMDSITQIIASSTQDVIDNLDQFTDSVNKGDIQLDEEIIMDSSSQPNFNAESHDDSDDFLEQVQAMQIGAWVEFVEAGSKSVHAKLSWKSNVTGKYVFVNRHGHKIKNITNLALVAELRSGRARLIEAVSAFDRAINSFMSTIRH